MERNLLKVIDELLEVIPEDHAIVPVLKDNRSSVVYAAPENHTFWWGIVCENLETYLKKPDTEWKIKVMDIITGKGGTDGDSETENPA